MSVNTRPHGVLFLCVANSARSQMAEGWGRRLLGPGFAVQSAGSRPSFVHPHAQAVMAEVGIDLSLHRSKSVDEIDPATVDTVITLCAEEVCPVFLGAARRLHWPIDDPAGGDPSLGPEAGLSRFRRARDLLQEKIAAFAAQPQPSAP